MLTAARNMSRTGFDYSDSVADTCCCLSSVFSKRRHLYSTLAGELGAMGSLAKANISDEL